MSTLTRIGASGTSPPVADVVFVHGLGGDGRGTWRTPGGDAWPSWVAEELPGAAVWTLEYDASPSLWFGHSMPLSDRAGNCLALLRARDVGGRPLCFVAHSLGGLLVKQMLRNAATLGTGESSIASRTRGVVFLATPHHGSLLASLASLVKLVARTSVSMTELQHHHDRLRELNAWYRANGERLGIATQVLYEMRPVAGTLVVDPSSADPGIAHAESIAIDADHFAICKPRDRDDLVHLSVSRFLRETIARDVPAPTAVPALPVPAATPPASTSAIAPSLRLPHWAAPRFADYHGRAALVDRVAAVAARASVVAIEGLPGAGKTYLASEVCRRLLETERADAICWYDPARGETLDTFLELLAPEERAARPNLAQRCKAALQAVAGARAVLVIDDYHDVDQESFRPLTELAAGHVAPGRLVLLSRERVPEPGSGAAIAHVRVEGVDRDDARTLLASRGVDPLPDAALDALLRVTDGLPFGLALFATLVVEDGYAPDALLGGSMLRDERIADWFDRVARSLDDACRATLDHLSVVEGPFDADLLQHVCGGDAERARRARRALEGRCLLQRYGPEQWRVHPLIAAYCDERMERGRLAAMHAAIAEYYGSRVVPGVRRGRPELLDDETYAVAARACRHYQLAGDHVHAARLLRMISRTAKRTGTYESFLRLGHAAIRDDPDRDPWTDYDVAHCAFVLGRVAAALDVVSALLASRAVLSPPLRCQALRLRAECMAARGDPWSAHEELVRARRIATHARVSPQLLAQLRSTQTSVLIRLGRLREAAAEIEDALRDGDARHDRISTAVAFTHQGIVHEASAQPGAAEAALTRGLALFEAAEDKRGMSWALGHRALARFALGREADADADLVRCLRLRAECGECSAEYLRFLAELADRPLSPTARIALAEESTRVRGALVAFG